MNAPGATDRFFSMPPERRVREPWLAALALSTMLHVAAAGLFLYRPAPAEAPAPVMMDVEIVSAEDLPKSVDTRTDIPEEPAMETAVPTAPAAETRPEEKERETIAEPEKRDDPPPVAAEQLTEPKPPEPQPMVAASQASAPAAASAADDAAEAAKRKETLKVYAAAVSAELNRRRIYPAVARERGIVGAVKVAFTIDEAGRVSKFDIVSSSGHTVLDEAVRKIMESFRAARPPAGAFASVVTIRFGLR